MKAKYALMMVAVSLTTFAQAQNAPPKKATEILEALSVPSKTPPISLDQRVAKMANLALIPADTTMCLAVLNAGPAIQELLKSPSFRELDIPSEIYAMSAWGVKDVIVASDAQFAKTLEVTTPFLAALSGALNTMSMMFPLISMLEHDKDLFGGAEGFIVPPLVKHGTALLKSVKIAPVLAVISMEPKLLAEAKANFTSFESIDGGLGIYQPHKGKYQGYDFSGVKLEGKKIAQLLRGSSIANVKAEDLQAFVTSIEKHNLYVLFAFKEDKMIMSISADPATDFKIAASAKESILATDKLDFTDHMVRPLAVGYCDAALSAALVKYQIEFGVASVEGFAKGAEFVFQEANIGDISESVASLKMFCANYKDLMEMGQSDQACKMAVWLDDGIQLEITAAGSGMLQSDKTLKLSSYANQPENILYAAVTLNPAYSAKGLSMMENAASAAWQFAEKILPIALSHMDKNNASLRQIEQMMPVVQMCKPELIQIWQSAKLALSGMDSEGILIIDDQGMSPPIPMWAPVAEEHLKKKQIPRFAYTKGIADRSKVSSAWDQMIAAMDNLLTSFSPPVEDDASPGLIGSPNKKEDKGIFSYTYDSPFFTAECKPCLSISDKVFVVGSSPRLNQSVAEAMIAPPTGTLKGAAFALQLAPLAKMISSFKDVSSKIVPGLDSKPINSALNALQHFDGLYGVMTDGKTTRIRLSIPMK